MSADDEAATEQPDARSRSRFGESRALRAEEIDRFLERCWWGVLSTLEAEYPHAVPVVYGWDGKHFYIASREGRKIANIRTNPGVCLNVLEVEEIGRHWTSVLVTGQAKLVTGPRSRLAAVQALRRQAGVDLPITRKDAARMAAARVIRISPRKITGRTRCD